MASVSLHPFGSGPLRDRTLSPTRRDEPARASLPPFWGSLVERAQPAASPEPRKSATVVGGLWIQIR